MCVPSLAFERAFSYQHTIHTSGQGIHPSINTLIPTLLLVWAGSFLPSHTSSVKLQLLGSKCSLQQEQQLFLGID